MAKATRQAYGEKLAELIKENEKIVVLDADLANATKTNIAQKAVPERFFDMGIAEADMIGHAAGLAASGYIPFASSFAMFATGRAWEQIRNSVAYPHLNVKVCGTHAGITVGEDGVSHQAIEDIALMRVIPNMEVYVPSDEKQTHAVLDHIVKTDAPTYVRLGRAAVADVYDSSDMDVTKINVLRTGTKAAIFACGVCVASAVEAADRLKEEGIDITVVDVCAIKPCDEEGIVKILESHDLIFAAEEHNVVGGLGGMIAELSTTRCPRRIIRFGIQDAFAESGHYAALMKKYRLDGDGIYEQLKEHL
ncbi:MAG: transketolase family protein [Solobacterium sp.]|nr:transketolase family protein [Solobacterium sp.]